MSDIQYVINKLEKIDTRLDGMGETMVRNTVSLETHVKRTDLLEASMAQHRTDVAKQIAPLKRAYNLGAAILVVLGVILSALKFLHEFNIL